MISYVVTFLIGALFAAGFALGGVTRPEVIVGFLDFAGDWNPSVMLVMGAAVPVTFVLYRLSFRRQRPLLASSFMVPTRRDIDARLVGGAALFGAGWGLIGLCPGPVLASLGSGAVPMYVFLVAMIGGMLLFSGYENIRKTIADRKANQQRTDPLPAAAERASS